jgi:hypothetical protein
MELVAFCSKTQVHSLYNQRMGSLQQFAITLIINLNMLLKEQLKLLEQQYNGLNQLDL